MKTYTIHSDEMLWDLANSLGTPIPSRRDGPIIDNLFPLEKPQAHRSSLSAEYGIEDFPYHTDGAYMKSPPKYIILRYIKGIAQPTPTVICDLSNVSMEAKTNLEFHVWKVQSYDGAFYTPILSKERSIYRYDPCIMRPAINTKNNRNYFERTIITSAPKYEIEWEQNKTVVIENWTTLHKRPKVSLNEIKFRHLQRIMVQ